MNDKSTDDVTRAALELVRRLAAEAREADELAATKRAERDAAIVAASQCRVDDKSIPLREIAGIAGLSVSLTARIAGQSGGRRRRPERIPYGDESDTRAFWAQHPEHTGEKCSNCGVTPGHLHEPFCDRERCPICGDQLIGCGHSESVLR